MKRQITCISCPVGCQMDVQMRGSEVISVAGNACARGEVYAKAECTHPMRTVTSTVRVHGADQSVVPVRTRADIPKEKVRECMRALRDIDLQAPVHLGQLIVENVCGAGVDIIATADAPRTDPGKAMDGGEAK